MVKLEGGGSSIRWNVKNGSRFEQGFRHAGLRVEDREWWLVQAYLFRHAGLRAEDNI